MCERHGVETCPGVGEITKEGLAKADRSVCVCVCVYVCEKERVRERERACVHVCMCVWLAWINQL